MADTYLMESIVPDRTAIASNSLARARELLADYDPDRDPVGSVLIDAVAAQMEPLAELVGDALATIFAHVAETAGHARIMPSPAAGLVTIATDGAQTRVLDAGATLRGALPDGSQVVLATTVDVTIPQGDTLTAGVPVEAIHDGLLVSIATPQALMPDQAYTWLTEVTLTELTAPGADGDDDDEYMDRASSAMQDQADMLILPPNVQRFVERIPGVGRCLVLDRTDATNPAAPVYPRADCLTVVVTGPNGSRASDTLLEDVLARLQARREIDFRFFVARPTYVPLSVELTAAAWGDALDVAGEQGEAAIRGWLHPATFAARGRGYGDGSWEPTSTVRVGESVSVTDSLEVIDYVDPTLVLINGVNADAVLSAPLAALPDPDNLSVTVHVVEREP